MFQIAMHHRDFEFMEIVEGIGYVLEDIHHLVSSEGNSFVSKSVDSYPSAQ